MIVPNYLFFRVHEVRKKKKNSFSDCSSKMFGESPDWLGLDHTCLPDLRCLRESELLQVSHPWDQGGPEYFEARRIIIALERVPSLKEEMLFRQRLFNHPLNSSSSYGPYF